VNKPHLLPLAQAGSIEARNEFAVANLGLINAAVKRCLPYDGTVREYWHAGFKGYVRAVESYDRKKGSFSGWLYWSVRHCVQESIRRSRRKIDSKVLFSTSTNDGSTIDIQDKIHTAIDDEVVILRECISRLPARDRYIITNRLDGKTLTDIGNDLGLSKERIRQPQRNAVRALGRAMESENVR